MYCIIDLNIGERDSIRDAATGLWDQHSQVQTVWGHHAPKDKGRSVPSRSPTAWKNRQEVKSRRYLKWPWQGFKKLCTPMETTSHSASTRLFVILKPKQEDKQSLMKKPKQKERDKFPFNITPLCGRDAQSCYPGCFARFFQAYLKPLTKTFPSCFGKWW